MLNNNNERELAYVAKITKIIPIEKADNIELVEVNGGWYCIAKKGEFQEQDLCVYFEIDSKLPEADWSEFLAPKHYKVKTMKLSKFGVISQGLALPFDAFGWEKDKYAEGKFLTKELNITYSVEEDNKRKAPSVDKYKRMVSRHPKVFTNPFVQKIYKTKVGKRVLYIFFGGKGKSNDWPAWVKKTDEERVENMAWILNDKKEWFATEKIDGTSTTFTLKRGKGFTTPKFYVCSRNVVFNTPSKKDRCYYDTNVYLEMAEKYNLEAALNQILFLDNSLDFITVQGETYGEGIQKRDYSLKHHNLMVFNVILGYRSGDVVRLNPTKMKELMDMYGIPCVPILNEHYILPDTIEELREYVNSETSKVDNKMREGIVFRSYDTKQSFKCVSPEYLLKYHG